MSADRKTGIIGSTILIGSALAISACGGGSKSNPESPKTTDNRTEATATLVAMPSATAIQEVPTATEVVPQKKLSEVIFKPTTFDEVTASIDAAYAQNPGNLSVPRDLVDKILSGCQSGSPGDAGNPKLIAADRQVGCTNLIVKLHTLQAETGSGAFFDAEVNVADYFLTDLPGRKQSFDQALERFIGDTSPALN